MGVGVGIAVPKLACSWRWVPVEYRRIGVLSVTEFGRPQLPVGTDVEC